MAKVVKKPVNTPPATGSREQKKYKDFRSGYKSGRNDVDMANAKSGALARGSYGQYNSTSGPRVGGPAQKPSVGPLKSASKAQVKASKSMVRKGTGSGASKAAKASRKRLG